jgi:hypothetical protein
MEFTYTVGTSFTKLVSFFHKVSFIINKLFLRVREALYVDGRKFDVEGSEHFTSFVFQPFRLCKKASS